MLISGRPGILKFSLDAEIDCLVYEMLFVGPLKPNLLNVQADSSHAPVYVNSSRQNHIKCCNFNFFYKITELLRARSLVDSCV